MIYVFPDHTHLLLFTAKQGQATILSLGTLASEHNNIVGHGGAKAVRE